MSNIPNPYKTTYTEWTVIGVLEEWINRILTDKGLSYRARQEKKISADQKRPDLIIEDLSGIPVCLIEIKPPSWDVYTHELVKDAFWKADKIRAPYFATCNINKLVFFGTRDYDENVIHGDKSFLEALIKPYDITDVYELKDIDDAEHKIRIQKVLEEFLTELVSIATGKKSKPRIAVDEYFISYLHSVIDSLQISYRHFITKKSKDKEFLISVSNWFRQQMWSFTGSPQDYERMARQAAYLLVNKILFYAALQEKFNLEPLDVPKSLRSGERLQKELQFFFNEVLKIDYETIFTTDFIDQIAFPEDTEAINSVKNLISEINRYRISEIGYDVLGSIFENLIPERERHKLGQYFTNANVVDLILKFCIQGENDIILDPACGAGTFLVRAYQHKKIVNPRLTHEKILPALWGVDISKFASHLTTINLAVRDLGIKENYPRTIHSDFFELTPKSIGFKKPVSFKGLGKEEKEFEQPEAFDAVVGNPPYTRQEEMEDLMEVGYKEELIEKALSVGDERIANIGKRAGIHVYFFTHGYKFLREGGRFGFIVSNSWLDVDYGKGLQEFFLRNYRIIAVIESNVERWFADADINTCIVILSKCNDKNKRDTNIVRFVQLKKRLENLIPIAGKEWNDEVNRIREIDKLVKQILFHEEYYENDEIRIYPKLQSELWNEGFDKKEKQYVGSKWGKYLRAPEIFFKIIEKCKDKLVPLKEIADVRFGIKTGANEFFYLTEEEIKHWGIEKEFWMHKEDGKWVPNYVIKSPRECKSIIVKPEDLKYRVLMIHKDKKELKGTNVLKYIEWGEQQGFDERPTCASREKWWDLPEIKAPILSKRFIDVSFGYSFNPNYVFVGDTFFVIDSKKSIDNVLIMIFLNSTIGAILTESYGRTPMGEGVLLLYGPEINPMPILNPKKFSKLQIQKLKQSFNKLCKREIGSIFEELNANYPDEVSLDKVKPDRRELDKIIMGEILGLSEKEQLEVYKAVIHLVKSRIEKAKSVKNRKKSGSEINIQHEVDLIFEEIGGKDILSKFYNEKILSEKHRIAALPRFRKEPEIERSLVGWQLKSGKDIIKCKTREEADYLKIFHSVGLDSVAVPENSEILKQISKDLKLLLNSINSVIEAHTSTITDRRIQNSIRSRVLSMFMNEVRNGKNSSF